MTNSHTYKCIHLPTNWGNDALTQFQTKAFTNELATFANSKWQSLLSEVYEALHDCSIEALSHTCNQSDSGYMLFVLANSQYLAAVRLVGSGHSSAVYPVCRSGIEYAMYGCYMVKSPEALERWHDKPNKSDRNALRNWSSEFKFSNLINEITDQESLKEWANFLYETSIEFGSHPNDTALYASLRNIDPNERSKTPLISVLNPANEFHDLSAKFTVETGLFILKTYSLVRKEEIYQQRAAELTIKLQGLITPVDNEI